MSEVGAAWADALLAARVLAVDPARTGAVVRAPAGPVRDAWMAELRALLPPGTPLRKVPPHVADDRLIGGLDLAATLASGRKVAERGILAEADSGVVVLAMAERVGAETAARLCQAMDAGEVVVERDGLALRHPARFGLVALDEGIAEDERPPAALADRAAFWIDLSAVALRDLRRSDATAGEVRAARRAMPGVVAGEDAVAALCEAALALGIGSARASVLALAVARALAALSGRPSVSAEDAALAARLVLAPRATIMPAVPEQADAEPAGNGQEEEESPDSGTGDTLADRVLAARRPMLPPDLLAGLQPNDQRPMPNGASGRSGQARRAHVRGRPVGARPGAPGGAARLHVVETLRAAAPWQRLRQAPPHGLAIRREDFRVVRTKHRTQTTTVFLVDASGSAALHRLGDAKGAVELLLDDCYIRRDRVALLAFRGVRADLLLPPTSALARAKRCLAALPGGGGTPLAAGLDAARALAEGQRRKGQSPIIVVLTDGRANVARDGTPGRAQAEADAMAAARAIRAAGLAALLVDTAPRPSAVPRTLAAEMGARFLFLPQADAGALSQAAKDARRG
ncbi:MAG: magnesium chelatase subunit D [Acetobacteraceae bacterium]|nr:magnesium chelatase subunit D [Acetobacteraceae bacterium]